MQHSNEVFEAKVATLIAREREAFAAAHPKSKAAFEQAKSSLFGGVPMPWMGKWTGGFPLYLATARGCTMTTLDGDTLVDFALGDTGAMAGHSAQAVQDAIVKRVTQDGGLTTMLPTEDAVAVGAELTRRFGLPLWSFTLSATDANRAALRLGRMITGRSKVLNFSYSYHGTVDETITVIGPNGETLPRPGNVGPQVHPSMTTRVAEFNDLASVERALAHGDVAVLITEPALTNIGIVLPEPGFLEGLRELCTRYGTLLLIDETHTISAGPGGMTGLLGLKPDIFVIGKSIAGGIAFGTFGMSRELADRILAFKDADFVDCGGIGGTLAGNALSMAAARAVLEHVFTEEAFARMIALTTTLTEGIERLFAKYSVPWCIRRLGARAEYRFVAEAPRNGSEAAAAGNDALDELMHLYLLNRGVVVTPFHAMLLTCPATTAADVEKHNAVFEEVLRELFA